MSYNNVTQKQHIYKLTKKGVHDYELMTDIHLRLFIPVIQRTTIETSLGPRGLAQSLLIVFNQSINKCIPNRILFMFMLPIILCIPTQNCIATCCEFVDWLFLIHTYFPTNINDLNRFLGHFDY